MASRRAIAASTALLLVAACAPHPRSAALARFETHLAAHDSATEALRLWCAAQGIARKPQIVAQPVRGDDQPPPASLRQQLQAPSRTLVGYRHVRLSCGGKVLSEAHNWYVASRLSPEMNQALAESDTPFGKVAAPLHFARVPLSTRSGRSAECPAGTISTHRALLRLPDGKPLALVVECYTPANLDK